MTSYLPRNVNLSNFEYTPVSVLPNGMKVSNVNYKSDKGILIQTPRMFCPFGASSFNDNGKYAVNMSLDSTDMSDKQKTRMGQFQSTIEQLESSLVDFATENQKELFGSKKAKSRDSIEGQLSSLIKHGKEKKDSDESYASTVKFNIKDYAQCTQEGEVMAFKDLIGERNFKALVVFKITGAWFSKPLSKFGFFADVKLIDIEKIEHTPMVIQSYDSDSDDECIDSDLE